MGILLDDLVPREESWGNGGSRVYRQVLGVGCPDLYNLAFWILRLVRTVPRHWRDDGLAVILGLKAEQLLCFQVLGGGGHRGMARSLNG